MNRRLPTPSMLGGDPVPTRVPTCVRTCKSVVRLRLLQMFPGGKMRWPGQSIRVDDTPVPTRCQQ